MSDSGQFETQRTAAEQAGAMDCAAFERWLTDAVENALPAAEALSFQAHAESCERCNLQWQRARQGHDWLALLRQQPIEPPAHLVQTILARTSGAARTGGAQITGALPGVPSISVPTMGVPNVAALPHAVGYPAAGGYPPLIAPRPWSGAGKYPALVTLRRTVFDPRLALTAAMAFFSISLTLNMVGIRLGDLRSADLKPANLRRTLTRQYVMANSSVVRYYENLRFVYEVESRVQELRHAAETSDSSGAPSQKKDTPHSSGNGSSSDGASGNGSSNDDSEPHRAPLARSPATPAEHAPAHISPQDRVIQVPLGVPVDASLQLPQKTSPAFAIDSSYDAREKNFSTTMIAASLPISPALSGCAPERSAV